MGSLLIILEIFFEEDRRIITPLGRLCSGSLLLLTATDGAHRLAMTV